MPTPVLIKLAHSRAMLPVLGGISGSTSTMCSSEVIFLGEQKKAGERPAF